MSEKPNVPTLVEDVNDPGFAFQVRDKDGYVWFALIGDSDHSVVWERTKHVSDDEWAAFSPALGGIVLLGQAQAL